VVRRRIRRRGYVRETSAGLIPHLPVVSVLAIVLSAEEPEVRDRGLVFAGLSNTNYDELCGTPDVGSVVDIEAGNDSFR